MDWRNVGTTDGESVYVENTGPTDSLTQAKLNLKDYNLAMEQ